ncbi:CBS domain-containing protein [Maledivibacter halophilus]|uniref:CBS-domain-containing membrane protein n=1 Tax=Maledivibacter halophilus TaxID=36842 RepID=A0A1T5M542_9FIRM|nr:CBS domain-containing protein [Maledivibacter halophilus]SKC83253.1 CBS-domain-containing membrane protein [Maledivibacter halophilus]
MIAKNIMNRDVVSIGENDTLKEAVILMVKHRVSGLPVIDKNKNIIGIISQSDIIKHGKRPLILETVDLLEIFIYEQAPEEYEEELKKALTLKVKNVMTDNIITVSENTSVGRIAHLMIKNEINRLPVIKDGKLVGIIGREDIIKAIANMSNNP